MSLLEKAKSAVQSESLDALRARVAAAYAFGDRKRTMSVSVELLNDVLGRLRMTEVANNELRDEERERDALRALIAEVLTSDPCVHHDMRPEPVVTVLLGRDLWNRLVAATRTTEGQ